MTDPKSTAKPVLPKPKGATAAHAAALFEQLMAKTLLHGAKRQYPLALAAIAKQVAASFEGKAPAPLDGVDDPDARPIKSPPLFAVAIRGSVPAPVTKQPLPPLDLSQAARRASVVTAAFGTAFEMTLHHDLLGTDVRCEIRLLDSRITAVFRVSDHNTRRLLEGHAEALRVRLEERGLRVNAVLVELEPGNW